MVPAAVICKLLSFINSLRQTHAIDILINKMDMFVISLDESKQGPININLLVQCTLLSSFFPSLSVFLFCFSRFMVSVLFPESINLSDIEPL